MKRYDKITKSRFRKQQNETNDCVVVAIAIAARMTYEKAHGICKYQGRKNRHSVQTIYVIEHLVKLGYTITEVPKLIQKSGSRYTAKTIGKRLKNGYYILRGNHHAAACVNGTVEDWSNNSKRTIYQAFKVTKTRAPTMV